MQTHLSWGPDSGLLPGDCWVRPRPLPWPTPPLDGQIEVWCETSDNSDPRRQSVPRGCLSSINVSIHHSISIPRVFHLCIRPFPILTILLCLHLHVLHLSIAHPYLHLFVISAHPYDPHPSLLSSLHPSINSALQCFLSSPLWILYPSLSPSPHFSVCCSFPASNHPITSPLSACPRVFLSLLCRSDGSLSDDRGHGCHSVLSLSVCSFSQFISHPHAPLRWELFSFLPLAADVTLCSPLTLSLRLMC